MNYCTLDNLNHPELIYSLIKEYIIDNLENDPNYNSCVNSLSQRLNVTKDKIISLQFNELRFITSKNF